MIKYPHVPVAGQIQSAYIAFEFSCICMRSLQLHAHAVAMHMHMHDVDAHAYHELNVYASVRMRARSNSFVQNATPRPDSWLGVATSSSESA